MAEGQSFDLYRQTMMGECLVEVLEGMMSSGKINEDLAMVICKTFDNSMLEALRNHVTARALIKANLKTYRYCDGVWQFYLQNVSLRLSGASAGSMASLPEVSCEQAKVILVDETVAPKATVAVSVEASAAAAGGDAAGADGAGADV